MSIVKQFAAYIHLMLIMLIAMTVLACGKSGKADTMAGSAEYPLVDWHFLVPPSWDGAALLNNVDLSKMQDDDPKAYALLKKLKKQWNNAPVVESLDGRSITIKGYPVPLDGNADFIKDFLLVPYFGACIHTPPPPSNQVIYVHLKGLPIPYNSMDAFTDATGAIAVRGILKVVHSFSALGEAGYQMQANVTAPTDDISP